MIGTVPNEDLKDVSIDQIRTKIMRALSEGKDLLNEEDIENAMHIKTFKSRFQYIARLIISGYQCYWSEPSFILNRSHDLQEFFTISYPNTAIEIAYSMDTKRILFFWKPKI